MPLEHLDNLLRDLSFVLPDVSVKDTDLRQLMTFDLHNLPEEFQVHLIYMSFFSMLEVEINHHLKRKENAHQDLENDLSETFRKTADTKISEARIKTLVQSDSTWKKLRDDITQVEYQLEAVKSVCSDLNRKGIALNVLTARGKAELAAGISH